METLASEQTKRCPQCGGVKPVSEFYRDARASNGLKWCCKICSHVYSSDGYKRTGSYYYQRNRIKRIAQIREYQKSHPSEYRLTLEYRVTQKKRHARNRGASVLSLTIEEWISVINKYDGCCAYCGEKLARVDMGHVIPISRGGQHTVENVVPCCGSCNSKKCNKLPDEYQQKARKLKCFVN
jgi:5-methylcytosine-specific restriction endonuclease McrA